MVRLREITRCIATSELRAADRIACGVPEDIVELRAGYLRV